MQEIYILGVSHIKANLKPVLRELKNLRIDRNTTVYIEPKKSILTAEQKCLNSSIEYFFRKTLSYIASKESRIIPLNKDIMHSHNTSELFTKYSLQLAEEEYMAEIISSSENSHAFGRIIVIIGDLHAQRLASILRNKAKLARYIKLAPITPDDIFAQSIRAYLDGKSAEYISPEWLSIINSEIRKCFSLKSKPNKTPQENFWKSKPSYQKYLKASYNLMQKYPHENYKITSQAGEETLLTNHLAARIVTRISANPSDHPILGFPYDGMGIISQE